MYNQSLKPLLFTVLLSAFGLLAVCIGNTNAQEKTQGSLAVEAFGDAGKQSDARVQIFAAGTQVPIATTKVGAPVSLPPGTYHLELDVLGGKVKRDKVLVKAGRTSTVMINEIAGLQVRVLDRKGREMGLGVEVYDGVSKQKLGDFLSGEMIFAYPGMVDVKVATPPQGQWWRDVELRSGTQAQLDLKERVQGELRVNPLLNGQNISTTTQVIIYQGGTQKEVARSEPGPEHRFALDAGTYDIFVGNPSGKGKPFVTDHAEVKGEETVEKDVPLDMGGSPPTPSKAQSL